MRYRIEGYWRRFKDEVSDLPWPEPDITWDGTEFNKKLTYIENHITPLYCKGSSISRITGEPNGCSEYRFKKWAWPEGLKHYILHSVKPSNDFMTFIECEFERMIN